jgi:hypothetical protein
MKKLSREHKSEVVIPYAVVTPKRENNEEITKNSRRNNGKE